MRPLLQVVHECELADFRARGAFFTWTNKHEIGFKVYSRIDRMLINDEWAITFPDSYVHYIPESMFDHCPALIRLEGEGQRRGTSFKYFNMWSLSPHYESIIRNGWQRECKGTAMFKVVKKLKGLKHDLKKLNKNQFGDIENLTHITEISLSIKRRRARNRVFQIRDINNNLCTKPEDIQQAFESYYELLLGTSTEVRRINTGVVKAGTCLSMEHCAVLNAHLTAEESKDVMFDIPGTKAPGPDGYSS
ncbi:uncharacterized protein LOC141601637 [Silene latifolia]|uniref:uncharacterized protein LOC141601637 n=1 Tax=Silene latifolia TaxID=37657 RepID=UPI003D77A738